MFEFLFKYPATVFSKGTLVLLSAWPVWILPALIAVAAVLLAIAVWRRPAGERSPIRGSRKAAIWGLQTALAALVFLLLWQPAISIATLKPQQNVIAVVVDDSQSMAIPEEGGTRLSIAQSALGSGILEKLGERFQVRLYRLGSRLERIDKLQELKASMPSTRINDALKQVVAESASLPIGAVLLLSDGADNTAGIDLEMIKNVRSRRLPIHTVGIGREQFARDLEISDVQVAPRTLADSRLSAYVSFRQRGYAGGKATLKVVENGKILAARQVTLKPDGVQQTEAIVFNAGIAGAKNLQFVVDALANEENGANNSLTRLVNVQSDRPRILYIEGEPRWEFKFIRRAMEEDRGLSLVSILRTTQNKIYRQGIDNPKELEDGFPSTVEDLFGYQAIILGGIEVTSFTSTQQELIRQFVDRRGGGLLFLAGRSGLADGGYGTSPLADLLPVSLPDKKNTFHRDPATVELTPAGRDSLICRLEGDPASNADRWKKLPYLANFQEVGEPKAGAVVLAEFLPTSKGRFPLLVTQKYGMGRTAVFASAGSWRWQMQQPLADRTHEMFWQQLLRWLATETPGRVLSSSPQPMLYDDGRLQLRARVHDTSYLAMADATVEARIIGPENTSAVVTLSPDPLQNGDYTAEWEAERPGSYLAEVLAKRGNEEIGRDVLMFRREDGVAEKFHAEQNRELLETLASETGGRYYNPRSLSNIADEIQYSEAGIATRETRDLWNMPAVFLLALLLRASEWLLRRRWGAV